MDKLLAALSLPQVGEIRAIQIENDPDRQGGLFELEIKSRVYTLKAKNDEDAQKWVTALKLIRDQGIKIGLHRSAGTDNSQHSPMVNLPAQQRTVEQSRSPEPTNIKNDWDKQGRKTKKSYLCCCK